MRWSLVFLGLLVGPMAVSAQQADAAPAPAASTNPGRRLLIIPPPPPKNTTPAKAPSPPGRKITIVAPGGQPVNAGQSTGDETADNPVSAKWSPQEAEEGLSPVHAARAVRPSGTLNLLPALQAREATAPPPGPRIDGHLREGPFLSGPGSFTFLFHQTFMGAAGGFATQGIANDFHFDVGAREAILASTLVGAGLGFGTGAWWQFHHWVGPRAAYFGIANSVVGGMFAAGLLNLTTDDPTALAWASVVGAEAGSWLTMGLSGGHLSLEKGMLISSGAAWGELYGAMLLAIIRFSGSGVSSTASSDMLMLAPGIGASVLAILSPHFHPSMRQLLRADIVGAGVGGVVLLVSSLVLGHLDVPTPYVLAMLSSGTAMAIVSVFWDDGDSSDSSHANAYRSVWW